MKRGKIAAVLLVILAVCVLSPPAGAEAGVTKNEILVGMTTVLVGPALFLGTSFWMGAETYLNRINETGGVHGRKIRLLVYDDGYEPDRAVANTKKLIKEDKVFCLFGNVGTPTAVAIKPVLESEGVPLFAPFTGAEVLRNPLSRYLLHYRASYNQELEAFISGVVDDLGYRKVAVFYQDDPYGLAVLNATKTALKKRGLDVAATGTYIRNFLDVSRALDSIMAAKPQAVVMAGTYSACAKFIMNWKKLAILKRRDVPGPVFMNVSFVGPDKLAELLDKYGGNVVVTQVVPPFSEYGNSYPAVTDYLEMLKRYFPGVKPSFVGLEGYLAARVFVEVLQRAGREVTRDSFIRTAEGIRDLDIQAGTLISFSDSNHQGSQAVYPTVIKDKVFLPIKNWQQVR